MDAPEDRRRSAADWEWIEREFRAGQLSVVEIARRQGITEGAVRKHAKAKGWQRALSEAVRRAVREKLARSDGASDQRAEERASDEEVIETAAVRGMEVVTSHRRDLTQLHGLKRILATRLSQVLDGIPTDGPCLGEKESPGDLLEKLSRVTSRLIPLERQAHNLDEAEGIVGAIERAVSARDILLGRISSIAARQEEDGASSGSNGEPG